MALATQCPFCQTVFRVAQDQLKLRDGLVRCGNCKQVFNGNEHLAPPELLPPPAASVASAAPVVPASAPAGTASSPASATSWPTLPAAAATAKPIPPAPPLAANPPTAAAPRQPVDLSSKFASIAAATGDAPWGAANPEVSPTSTTATTSASKPLNAPAAVPPAAVPEPSTAAQEAEDSAALEQALNALAADTQTNPPLGLLKQSAPSDNHTDLTADAPGSQTDRPSAAEHMEATATTGHGASDDAEDNHANGTEADTAEADQTDPAEDAEGLEDEDEDDADAPGFVQRAQRRERLRSITRVVMLVGSVLLSISLLLQGVYFWRNQIVAWLPATQPAFSALCGTLHCTVGLPADIEQLSLESNELQQVPPNQNIYTLTVLLHNRSRSAQAWPYLELSLNDSDEKPITRRAFAPREYLTSAQQISKGLAGNSDQQIKLTFELAQPVAAGYRIYLFYP